MPYLSESPEGVFQLRVNAYPYPGEIPVVVPNPNTGDAGQSLKTNGTTYYFGGNPTTATAYQPSAGVIAVTIPAIDGTAYLVPDFAEADDFSFVAIIDAFDVAGSFTVAIAPQTGAGLMSTTIVSDGVGAEGVTLGNGLPSDLSNGAVLNYRCDGTNGWQVECTKFTLGTFDFVTAVADLRSHLYVGGGHDGGGVTDYIDQTRTGDDPGFYMAADNAELLTTGVAFPGSPPYTTTTASMIALRNQASGAGEGITGFYHARRMPTALTFTISTPLGDVTVTPANYGSPQPVAGDVCLINGMTVDGQWQDSNIKEGEDLAVGGTMTWRTTDPGGMFCDFEDISPSAGSGDLLSTNNLSDVASAATARTNLGLAIGTDVQAHDADLAAVAALSPSNDDIVQRKSGAWTNRTMAQLAADLWLPVTARRTADATPITANTTLADDSSLSVPIGASETHTIEAWIYYTSGNTADFQFAVTGPSGATCQISAIGPTTTDNTIVAVARLLSTHQTLGTAVACGGFTGAFVRVTGTIYNSTNAGNVKIQWAQNTSDAASTYTLKGSTLTLRRVA